MKFFPTPNLDRPEVEKDVKVLDSDVDLTGRRLEKCQYVTGRVWLSGFLLSV